MRNLLRPGVTLLFSSVLFCRSSLPALARTEAPPSITSTRRTLTTLEWVGRPVTGLIERWANETELPLVVGSGLQEQKVTVSLPPRASSAAALPNIATLLHARWTLIQAEPPRWSLERRPEVQRELARQKQAAAQLDADVRREQNALTQRAVTEGLKGLDHPPRNLGEGIIGRPYLNNEPSAEPLIRLLGTLSPDQRSYLATHPNTPIAMGDGGFATDRTPTLNIPLTSLSPQQQGLVREFFSSAGIAADLTGAVVQFSNHNGTSVSGGALLRDGSHPGNSLLLVAEGPALKTKSAQRQKGTADYEFEKPWAFTPNALERLDQIYPQRVAVELRELDYADAVAQAGKLLNLPIAADFYTRSNRCSFKAKNAKASEVISTLARAFGCTVRWEGDTLLLRSIHWPELDEREIPERLFTAWVQQRQQLRPEPACLPLQALANMFPLLGPEQTFCLADYRNREFPDLAFEWEAQVLRRDGDVLGFYAALPEAARRKLTSAALPLRDLPVSTRPALTRLLERRAAWLLTKPDLGPITLRLTSDTTDTERSYTLEIRDPSDPSGGEYRYPTMILDVTIHKPE